MNEMFWTRRKGIVSCAVWFVALYYWDVLILAEIDTLVMSIRQRCRAVINEM